MSSRLPMGVLEDAQSAEGNVLQIADGGSDQVKSAHGAMNNESMNNESMNKMSQ